MKAPLNLLTVEDSEADAKLIVRELSRTGHSVDFERVQDPRALRSALQRRPWDLVTSDWSMPSFTAHDALALVKELQPDLPFIIVSGTMGETAAVEAMRAGAHDYVLKDNLTRLAPAVERELRESKSRANRRRAEESLRESEARYRILFDKSPAPKWLYDVETLRFLEVNEAAIAHYGYSREEFLQMSVKDLRPPEDVAGFMSTHGPLRLTPFHADHYRHRKKDGTVIDVEVTAHTLVLQGRRARLVVVQDVTARRGAEEALRASEEQVRLLLDSTGEGIYGIDLQGNCTFANASCLRMLGYPDQAAVLGKNMHQLVHHTRPDGTPYPVAERKLYHGGLRGEGAHVGDEIIWRADGTHFAVEYYSMPILRGDQPIGAVVSFIDVSARKKTEEALNRSEDQLRQAQKMEAIGQLTGGVAHDFNNILSIILSYSSLLLEDLKEGNQMRHDVLEIQDAGERAADLTRQLLAFSRRQILQPRVVDLNGILAGTEKMLRRLIGEDIELTTLPAPEGAKASVDPGQIEQVIMNLAVNARDAMPHGGKLTIEIARVDLDAAYAGGHAGMTPGPYLMVAVSDSGLGMDAETKARIFEPFFTTKEVGKGTGLGLSTVFGIVRQSGGHIWVYSEPGKGTTFKIYFPPASEGARSRALPERIPEPATLCGHETILLVEDDERLRKLTRTLLSRHGYRVLEAQSGGDALLICERPADRIHLLLTDVIMPHMSGPELAVRLATMRPDLAIVYMSGYTDNAVLSHGFLEATAAFVQKPFTPNSLLRKVRDVLDELERRGDPGLESFPSSQR